MDIIFISDFRLEILIGVYEWERRVPQTVQLDLEIGLPPARSAPTGSATRSTTRKSSRASKQSFSENRFLLVEALAEHIAQLVLTEFGAPWVKASVTKLGRAARREAARRDDRARRQGA